jgi:hypothetical protein
MLVFMVMELRSFFIVVVSELIQRMMVLLPDLVLELEHHHKLRWQNAGTRLSLLLLICLRNCKKFLSGSFDFDEVTASFSAPTFIVFPLLL